LQYQLISTGDSQPVDLSVMPDMYLIRTSKEVSGVNGFGPIIPFIFRMFARISFVFHPKAPPE